MANIKSAIKRIQVAERNRLRNKSYKSSIKTLTKRYFAALANYASDPSSENLEVAQKEMAAVFSRIDKGVKRGVYHKNAGARRKSSLSRAWKQIESQQAAAS